MSYLELASARHRRPILLPIGLGSFNQLSGINGILCYLGDISRRRVSTRAADLQSVAICATHLVATLLGIELLNREGLHTLILVGSVGAAAAPLGVALIIANDASRASLLPPLIVFLASFAIPQGAVIRCNE
jgi:hypothetical protein